MSDKWRVTGGVVPSEYERSEGCGQIDTSYRGPAPAYLYGEPSLDRLRREALRELVDLERECGLDLPPRNPGLVEDGDLRVPLPIILLLACLAGFLLVLVVAALS